MCVIIRKQHGITAHTRSIQFSSIKWKLGTKNTIYNQHHIKEVFYNYQLNGKTFHLRTQTLQHYKIQVLMIWVTSASMITNHPCNKLHQTLTTVERKLQGSLSLVADEGLHSTIFINKRSCSGSQGRDQISNSQLFCCCKTSGLRKSTPHVSKSSVTSLASFLHFEGASVTLARYNIPCLDALTEFCRPSRALSNLFLFLIFNSSKKSIKNPN